MAASSTATGATTAYYIATRNHFSPTYNRLPISPSFSTYLKATKPPKKFLLIITNSGDGSVTATEEESEVPVEVPERSPSLISALNVEKALRGIAITDVDHYDRLGLRSGCSYDQVNVAFKNKVTEVMNRGLAAEELNEEVELLKESHSILSTVEERRLYDWSLARSGKPDKYVWPFEVDITQTPTEIPPPQEPDDEGPTRLVGYFILSWLTLSVILFIVINR
ncbi:hypothetical protein ACP275_01G008400 [Erythranthe tilingii]